MSFSYTDMDQLIIQRWPDVVGLIDAQRQTQDRIEEMIDVVGERVARWARPLGFEVATYAKDAEFQAWRPAWADKRKGPKMQLALGGFCPIGYRRTDAKHPYYWVYIEDLGNFKVKEAERTAFSHSLRAALGEQAKGWEAPGVDDTTAPLGRYVTTLGATDQAQFISSPDALYAFVTEHFPRVYELADILESELVKLGR